VIKSESLTTPTGYSTTSAVTVAPFADVVTTRVPKHREMVSQGDSDE